jgi:hypothetical protein
MGGVLRRGNPTLAFVTNVTRVTLVTFFITAPVADS